VRDVIHGGLGVVAAFIVYTVLSQISVSLLICINVFTMMVILFALIKGETAGAIMGMACGLVIDSFSLGIFGLSGIANTVTGFTAGYVSRKLNVLPPGRLFVFIGLMGALDLGLWMLMASVFFAEGFPWGGAFLLAQPLFTAVLGTLVFWLYRRIRVRNEG